MRTRLVWLFVGAAIASVGILVIPAWANTLSDNKARDKATNFARVKFNRDSDFKRRTRAYIETCKRQKLEGSQDLDPHRIACRVKVSYYWYGLGPPPLPPAEHHCILVKKSHSTGHVKADVGSGC